MKREQEMEKETITVRNLAEIIEFEKDINEKFWYFTHIQTQGHEYLKSDPESRKILLEEKTRLIRKYGKKNITIKTDIEEAMLQGIILTLRWVLGEKWNNVIDVRRCPMPKCNMEKDNGK